MNKKASRRTRLTRFIAASLGLSVAGLGNQSAHGQWVGDTSSDWNNPLNWNGDVFPTGVNVTINTGTLAGPFPILTGTSMFTPVDVFVGQGSGNTGRLDIRSGFASTGSGNWIWAGENGGTGVINVADTATTGGTFTGFGTGSGSFTAGRINVGAWGAPGSNGTFNVNTSGTVTGDAGGDRSIDIGENGSTGVFNLDAGTVNTVSDIWVGTSGTGSGTFRVSGGTVNDGGQLAIGRNTTGTFIQSGGTVNTNSWLIVGLSGTGSYTLSGGTVNAGTGSNLATLASFGGAQGTLTVSGGTFNSLNGINVGEGGKGTLTVSGGLVNLGTSSRGLRLADNGAGDGTVNLNGGVIQTAGVYKGAGTSGTINFNGGTLRATMDNTAFMQGLDTAALASGTSTIDSNGFNITVNQALGGNGGLIKSGSGTLTLGGSNSYTGNTAVNVGTLAFATSRSNLAVSNVSVASNAGLSVKAASGTSSILSTASLTLGTTGTSNTSLTFDFNSLNTTVPMITTGALTVNGTAALSFLNPVGLASGSHSLINYTSFTGGVFSGTSLTFGHSLASVSNSGSNLFMTVTAGTVTYTGSDNNGLWRTGTTGANANWKISATKTDFLTGDTIVFDDTATGTPIINVSGTGGNVNPGSVSFNNSALSYSLTGTAGIAGSAALTKSGAGLLTISNSNSYTGVTTLNAGTINVNNAAALGGTGSMVVNGGVIGNTSGSNIVLSSSKAQTWGGDFTYSGSNNLSFNGGAVTITGGTTRTVNLSSSGTLGVGTITSGSGAGLTLTGTGGLTMTSSAVSNIGGTLSVGSAVTLVMNTGTNAATTSDLSVNGLSGGGTIQNGGLVERWLFVNNDVGNNTTFSGRLQDGGAGGLGLNKTGVGILSLTGSNLVSGLVTVAGGTLAINGGSFTVDRGTQVFDGNINVGLGNGELAYLTLSSGSLGAKEQLALGGGAAGVGNYIQTGGTANIGGFLAMGLSSGTGVYTQSGGVSTVGIGTIGAGAAGTGSISLSGSAVMNAVGVAGSELWVGENGKGSVNISGNALLTHTNSNLIVGKNAGSNGTVSLTGGTLRVKGIAGGSGTSTLSISGGTIQASGSSTSFMSGLTSAVVQSGGGTINNNGFSITIPQALTSGSSPGTLTFSGAGKTLLSGQSSLGAVMVANSSAFGVKTTGSAATPVLTASSLTLGSTGAALAFDLGNTTTPLLSPAMNITGALTASGSVGFRFTGAEYLTSGTAFALVSYGSLSGSSFIPSTVNLTTRTTATLTKTGSSLNISNIVPDSIRWNVGSGNWDIETSPNFVLINAGGPATAYLQSAATGTDATVTFNDAAIGTGTLTVTMNDTLTPLLGVVVNNNTKTYKFAGSGQLGGSGSLTKSGTGNLIIDITGSNSYSGGTTINGGTVYIGDPDAPALSVSSNAINGALTMNGGTLDLNGFITPGLVVSSLTGTGGVITTNFFTGGTGIVLVNSTTTGTFGGRIVDGMDPMSLTKQGASVLALTGSNTYSGRTLVDGSVGGNANILRVAANNALSPNSVLQIDADAKLELNGFSATVGGLTTTTGGAAQLVQNLESGGVGTGILTINVASGTSSYLWDGIIRDRSGVLALAKTGAGTQVITNTNPNASINFTGGLTVSGGTLTLRDSGNGRTITSFASNIVNNATLGLSTLAGTQTLSTAISGSGNVLVTGSNVGTVVLAGSNNYTGSTTVSSGTLGFRTSQSSIGSVTVADNAGLSVKVASGSSSLLSTTSLTLGTSGSTTLAFDFSSLNTTAPVISTGLFTRNGTINLSLLNLGGLTSGSHALLSYTGTAGSGVFTGTSVTYGRSSATVSQSASALFLTASNVVIAYTGSDNNGIWATGTTGPSKNWLATGTATDYIAGDLVSFDDTATGTSTINIASANVSPASVTFNNSTKNYTITSGSGFGIAGTGGITKSGTGMLTISTANTYTGPTTINAGTVAFNANNNLGADTAAVNLNGGTLRTLGGLTNTHPITIGAAGGTINVVAGGQYFFNTANTLLGSGSLTVTGGGTLAAQGVGNLRIAQTNTFNGNVTVMSGGIFEYGTQGAVDAASKFFIGNEGELALQGNAVTTMLNSITVTGGSNSVLSFQNGNSANYGGTITLNASATVGLRDWYNYGTARSGTISGVISGVGGLTVSPGNSSGGILYLTAANTYTGTTTIVNGANLYIGAGGTTGSLATTSNIVNNGALFFNRADTITQGTNFGVISGSGNVVVAGSGTVILSSSNSYTGLTGVGFSQNGAVVRASNSNAFGTGLLAFDSGGNNSTSRVELTGGITLANAVDFFGRNNTSVGIQSLSGSNTLSGAMNLGIGGTSSRIQSDAGFLTLAGSIATTATTARNLVLQGTGNGRVSGVIANGTTGGSINLNKQGTGTWTLSAANTYSGTTDVNGGTLRVNGSTGTGLTTVNSGATLSGTGTVAGGLLVNSGGTVSPGASPGTLSVTGSANFTSGGVLLAELGGNTGSGQDHLNATGAVTLGATSSLQLRFFGETNPNNLIKAGTYTLMTGASVSGSFGTVTDLGVYDDGGGLAYTGTSVTLTLTKNLLGGDANMSGTTNATDFNALAANWLGSGKTWSQGDFNGDGVVNASDFNVLSTFWLQTAPLTGGSGSGGGSTSSLSAVPEPNAVALLLVGALGLVGRRRRKHMKSR